MTQIGESVSIDIDVSDLSEPETGDLTVLVREQFSDEAVAGVKVTLSGASSGSGTTDAGGEAKFSGIAVGQYQIALAQDEFELAPDSAAAGVVAGEPQRVELAVRRVMLTLVVKRIHIRGILKAMRGDKSDLEYGHWWIEIDGAESYGWWPHLGVGPWETLRGVPGSLNGQGPQFRGTPTRDPHHGDTAEEMFHPAVHSGKPAAAIKSSIRSFAQSYSGKWSWPWGQNCHSFQEAMMEQVRLSKSGRKQVK